MRKPEFQLVYGPVPSRRLGRSLGVDLVPYKTCSYDCTYCQLGRTTNKTLARKEYVSVNKVLDELAMKLETHARPDFIGMAGSGEPTLHSRLGELITAIKKMTSTPIAVLTNGSLLWMPEVRENLSEADLVLPSLDAGDDSHFQAINRPHAGIDFAEMVEGIATFTKSFHGQVWLEVFLLNSPTGFLSEVMRIAELTKRIAPARVQLNTIHRPPAEEFASPIDRRRLHELKGLFAATVDVISEGEQTNTRPQALSDLPDEEFLALLSRRPCRSRDVAQGLSIHINEAIKRLEQLCSAGRVRIIKSAGQTFFTPALPQTKE